MNTPAKNNSLIIVGAGLTGLFAAVLAVEKGIRVIVAARAWGKLPELSGRFTDLPGDQALNRLRLMLPDFFVSGDFLLPGIGGRVEPAALIPQAQAGAHITPGGLLTVGDFPGFQAVTAPQVCASLRETFPRGEFRPLTLPLPDLRAERELYASDLARNFDDPAYLEKVIEIWRPHLRGVHRIVLPAVLGLYKHPHVYERLTSALRPEMAVEQDWLSEMPTLAPSVPGLRIQHHLVGKLRNLGVEIILGSKVAGRIEQNYARVHRASAGRSHPFPGSAVLLASGDLRYHGLEVAGDGLVRDTVFNLPAEHGVVGDFLSQENSLPHPDVNLGLQVNKYGQVLVSGGSAAAENLFAAGDILSGGNHGASHSLDSAYTAVEGVLAYMGGGSRV